jgi:receptor expression-enhancing protein 1/2/3/4
MVRLLPSEIRKSPHKFICRIPFYYATKTLFLLYLALPQTHGSSYLYTNHLQPFFASHESQIDAALASFKARIYTIVQERLRMLWEHVTASIGQQQQRSTATFDQPAAGAGAAAPPSLGDPVSGPVQLMSTFWNSYGPSIIATGTALLRQTQYAAASSVPSREGLNSPPIPPQPVRQDTTQSVLDRRRALEAELASLPPVPIPPADPATSRSSSASDIRERTRKMSVNGEKFVEVPSDVEGYDVRDETEGSASGAGGKPASPRKSSGWFGWGGSANESAPQGYERVKSD